MTSPKRCTYLRPRDGEQCRHLAVVGRDMCWLHDPDRQCTAQKANGERCTRPASDGTHRCSSHGGKSKAVKNRMEMDKVHVAAAKIVDTYGLPRTISAEQALLEEIARTAGAVEWLGRVVAELTPEQVAWNLQQRTVGSAAGCPTDLKVFGAAPNVWINLYQKERAHLVNVSVRTLAAGVAERQVRVAESYARILADVLSAVLADPELDLGPERQEVGRRVAGRHLRALAAGSG